MRDSLPLNVSRTDQPLRADPSFRLYWLARITAIFGASISLVAVPVVVLKLSGSATLTGIAASLNGIAFLALGLGSGALADRRSRLSIMVTCDALRAIVIAGIPIAFFCGVRTLWVTFPLLMAGAALFVFFDAANLGALRSLVGPDRIARANGAVWSASTVAEMAGPMAAALALHALSPEALFFAESVCCLISATCLWRLRTRLNHNPRQTPTQTSAHAAGTTTKGNPGLLAGWRFVWSTPLLRSGLIASAGQALAEGMIAAQLVTIAGRLYGIHAGSAWLGSFYLAIGAGAFVASLLLPRFAERYSFTALCRGSLIGSMVMLALAMLNGGPLLLVGVLFVWSGCYLLTFVGAVTHRQRVCPEELQGRVSVVGRISAAGIGVPLGAFLGGIIADTLGIRLMLAAALTITLTTLITFEANLRTFGKLPASKKTGVDH